MPTLGGLFYLGTHLFCDLISLHEMFLMPQEQVSFSDAGQITIVWPEANF